MCSRTRLGAAWEPALSGEDLLDTNEMKPSDALTVHRAAVRRTVAASLRAKATSVRLGRASRRREGRDLDMLVDPLPGATLRDLGGLQWDLQEMLGVEVDLLTPRDLPARYRAEVIREAVPV